MDFLGGSLDVDASRLGGGVILTAIACSVFMGANSYIGNGPSFFM